MDSAGGAFANACCAMITGARALASLSRNPMLMSVTLTW